VYAKWDLLAPIVSKAVNALELQVLSFVLIYRMLIFFFNYHLPFDALELQVPPP